VSGQQEALAKGIKVKFFVALCIQRKAGTNKAGTNKAIGKQPGLEIQRGK
jgi:hypothetical protein